MNKVVTATATPKPEGAQRKVTAHNGTKPPLRILHLEDNQNDAELVCLLLESEGFSPDVVRVQTRSEFAAAIENDAFEVILSDFSLPSFDGQAALALARRECAETPFIFVSGTLGEEAAIESLRHGATDYVVKSRLNRLGPAIHRTLREKQEQQERKQAEKDLRRSSELFRQITENVADLIAVLDLEGNWLYTSPSYGTVLSEWCLRPGADSFAEVYPEDEERMRQSFRNTIERGVAKREEFRLVFPNGGLRFIETQASVIREEGVITNVVTVSRDITERKRAEEQLQRIQAELEQSNKDLLRQNQEIQNFYHTLSHELKTPLTSAREFISIVMEGLAGSVTETQFDYLRIAKESCNQLRFCLNDLLDATRLETGKLKMELKSACLGNLVHEVMTMMGPVAAKKKIRLAKKVQPGLPDVPIDANRITQVITNLLNNALKFTPEGGKITLEVTQAPRRPDYLRVAVSDTGRGIPQDKLDRIFNRLFQVKLGDASTEQGVGLGLYICLELVELHGGQIWVESELDKGSTFTFEIPKQPGGKRSTVLVVDDNATMLETVRYVLEKAEFHVVTAAGGAEALRLMEQQTPDVVVLDLQMPVIDGAATLKEIRKKWGPLPVLIYTGFPDSELMTRAMESSPFTCLSKPCSETQLVETVRMLKLQSDLLASKKPRKAMTTPIPLQS